MLNKKAMETEKILEILMWIIFFALAALAISFLLKKLTM